MKKIAIASASFLITLATAFSAQNFIRDAGTVDWLNTGAAVASGQVIDLGDRYGVVLSDVASNAIGAVKTAGMYKLLRVDTNAITDGQILYYSTATSVTITATADKYLGSAVGAVSANSGTPTNLFVIVDINAAQRTIIPGVDVLAYNADLTKGITTNFNITSTLGTNALYFKSGVLTNRVLNP